MIRLAILLTIATAVAVHADPPEVVDVVATESSSGWRFDVTIAHPDTGWDHYADGWEVLAPDGTRLGFRELYHPHVDEQPFTRSLSGVAVPDGITEVIIRPRCNTTGWAEEGVKISLPTS
ncbi:MAG: hypothetical protein AAGF94_03550 [Pseudomonadota bacterium]